MRCDTVHIWYTCFMKYHFKKTLSLIKKIEREYTIHIDYELDIEHSLYLYYAGRVLVQKGGVIWFTMVTLTSQNQSIFSLVYCVDMNVSGASCSHQSHTILQHSTISVGFTLKVRKERRAQVNEKTSKNGLSSRGQIVFTSLQPVSRGTLHYRTALHTFLC